MWLRDQSWALRPDLRPTARKPSSLSSYCQSRPSGGHSTLWQSIGSKQNAFAADMIENSTNTLMKRPPSPLLHTYLKADCQRLGGPLLTCNWPNLCPPRCGGVARRARPALVLNVCRLIVIRRCRSRPLCDRRGRGNSLSDWSSWICLSIQTGSTAGAFSA